MVIRVSDKKKNYSKVTKLLVKPLLNSLSLQYNRQRQAKITQEITEVAAGAKARRQQLQKKKRSQSTCK